MYVFACPGAHLEVREQLTGLPVLCGAWRLNSDYYGSWQVPLSSEPSCRTLRLFYNLLEVVNILFIGIF